MSTSDDERLAAEAFELTLARGDTVQPGERLTFVAGYLAGLASGRASLTRAEAVVEACVEWQEFSGDCHFCHRIEGQHDAECILVEQGYVSTDGQRRKGDG